MSASLVGSEMCIRDSYIDIPHLGSPQRPTTTCSSHRPHHPTYAIPTPVSYTHLTLPTICSV
eukprot:547536-Alexandrium_andersonii.AAC.1